MDAPGILPLVLVPHMYSDFCDDTFAVEEYHRLLDSLLERRTAVAIIVMVVS